MADEEQYRRLLSGIQEWNAWRSKNPDVRIDLSGALLSGASLRRADLHEADLTAGHLTGADLFGSDLRRSDLRRAQLSRARLEEAILDGAYLTEANLQSARARGAHFTGAHLGAALLQQARLQGSWLQGADLTGADLREADLTGANLTGALLQYATLVEAALDSATLTDCKVYGVSAWNTSLDGAVQTNLAISKSGDPTIVVDNLELAQFLYLLLDHKKLRDVLIAVSERGVLLLGGFRDGGLERLQAMAAVLRDMRYLPIIFDFDRPSNRTYTETVKTLVGLSRFVIADMSGPSVPQELTATLPHFKVPFVFILEQGKAAWAMSVDLLENAHVIQPPVVYADTSHLLTLLRSQIVDLAENKYHDRRRILDDLFGKG
jgi:uncharacterized protein YjbI with pentapeptide repeats